MDATTFRWAAPKDRERIFEVVARAFHLLRGSARWRQTAKLVESCPGEFRVLEQAGEIVGVGFLASHQIQIGSAEILLGYLGQISILPELQDRGLGSALVCDLLEQMEQKGYDVARLSGLVRFYARFGWSPFPRRFIEFPLRKLRAGTAEVSVADMLEARPAAGKVRDYHAETDRRRRDSLLRRFNDGRTGASKTPRSAPSNPLPNQFPLQWQLVYEEQGKLLGYLATQVFAEDVSDFEASVNLRDVAFDLRHPQAVIQSLRYVLSMAHQRGAGRVTARLPWDPKLFSILREAGLVFEQVELVNCVTGNMLRLMDLSRLLTKIAPELSIRWRQANRTEPVELTISIGKQKAHLNLTTHGVVVAAAPAPNALKAPLTQFEFLSLVLGLAPVESVVARAAEMGPAAGVLAAIFPVQPTASANWG